MSMKGGWITALPFDVTCNQPLVVILYEGTLSDETARDRTKIEHFKPTKDTSWRKIQTRRD